MKHRGLTLLLALVFLLSVFMFCTTAFAAEESADGLEAVLSTDKKDYVNGKSIGVTLDVTNTSIYVNNIRTELIIPEGVDLVEGQLKSDAAAIAVGQKVVCAKEPTGVYIVASGKSQTVVETKVVPKPASLSWAGYLDEVHMTLDIGVPTAENAG